MLPAHTNPPNTYHRYNFPLSSADRAARRQTDSNAAAVDNLIALGKDGGMDEGGGGGRASDIIKKKGSITIGKFLNRLLALTIEKQNQVFVSTSLIPGRV